ncbi:hypothetical protein [Nitrososphaera sp.]|uniref:hypothetical protein n=1 Tax=Nitrososphaera sp. TaxID=1971748 RepID=UPI00307FCDE8
MAIITAAVEEERGCRRGSGGCIGVEERPSFEEAYSAAVAEGMKILGEKVAAVVENYLEQKYSIRLEDTVNNPQALADALDAAIDGGARVVLRRILRVLHQQMDLDPPTRMTVDYAERIREVKKQYMEKHRQ